MSWQESRVEEAEVICCAELGRAPFARLLG